MLAVSSTTDQGVDNPVLLVRRSSPLRKAYTSTGASGNGNGASPNGKRGLAAPTTQTGSRRTPSRQKVLPAFLLGNIKLLTNDVHRVLAFCEHTQGSPCESGMLPTGRSISGRGQRAKEGRWPSCSCWASRRRTEMLMIDNKFIAGSEVNIL